MRFELAASSMCLVYTVQCKMHFSCTQLESLSLHVIVARLRQPPLMAAGPASASLHGPSDQAACAGDTRLFGPWERSSPLIISWAHHQRAPQPSGAHVRPDHHNFTNDEQLSVPLSTRRARLVRGARIAFLGELLTQGPSVVVVEAPCALPGPRRARVPCPLQLAVASRGWADVGHGSSDRPCNHDIGGRAHAWRAARARHCISRVSRYPGAILLAHPGLTGNRRQLPSVWRGLAVLGNRRLPVRYGR